LKVDVQKAIEAGELTKADELLASIENRQAAALNRLALNAADTSAQREKIRRKPPLLRRRRSLLCEADLSICGGSCKRGRKQI